MSKGDKTRIVPAANGLTRGAVHAIVKKVFKDTANRLRQPGGDSLAIANRVEQASAHWLRHTTGSHMASNAFELCQVQANLGRESITTTAITCMQTTMPALGGMQERHQIGW